MRALYIHAKEFSYRPVMKVNITSVEDTDNKEYFFEDCLVVFISVEKGDFSRRKQIIDDFLNDLKQHIQRIGITKLVIYPYAHLSDNLEEARLALRFLRFLDRIVKASLEISYHRAPFGWYKEFMIHCLGHPLSELSRSFK